MTTVDFIRDITLEESPYIINKEVCNFEAYSYGCDYGFVILDYNDFVELYEFDSGPYHLLRRFNSFTEAVEYANNLS